MKIFVFYLKYIVIRFRSIIKLNDTRKNESLSREKLDDLVLLKLKKIFTYAKSNSPYYAEKFKDISISDIRTLSDWNKLPVLTKEDIRNNFDDIIVSNINKSRLREVTTGGSTGQPLKVYHDRANGVDALGWRALKWWGVHPSDNIAFIYRKVKTGIKAKINYLLWLPTKRFFLDAAMMTPETMDIFIERIHKDKPKVINGYVGAVVEFSKYCIANKIELSGVKAVWVTAAPLSESHRKIINDAFGCPVFDQYGCSEVYWIAVECKHQNGLHVFEDSRYLEIVDDDNMNVDDGLYGSVTITDFENLAFPFIRYVNGDRGRYLFKKEQVCECGISYKKIDKIKGRISECIRNHDGVIVAGEYLTTIFDDHPNAVSDFQIKQCNDFSVILSCVINKGCDNSLQVCESKLELLRGLLGSNLNISLCIIDKINHDAGKTRFIISEIEDA